MLVATFSVARKKLTENECHEILKLKRVDSNWDYFISTVLDKNYILRYIFTIHFQYVEATYRTDIDFKLYNYHFL